LSCCGFDQPRDRDRRSIRDGDRRGQRAACRDRQASAASGSYAARARTTRHGARWRLPRSSDKGEQEGAVEMSSNIAAVEFAALAANAYAEPKDAPKGSRVFRWTRQNFLGDPTNGFFAAAYHSGRSAQLVIAYRGSGGDLGDWGLAGNLGNMFGVTSSKLVWNSQLNTAIAYFDACRSIYSPSSVAVCGHSLGGFLAAMVALKRGVRGITFDRPSLFYSSIATLGWDSVPSGSNLVNFRGKGDPVSAIRDGYGRWITVELNTISNIVAGRGRATLTHSIDELYEAMMLHPKSDKPPENW
jgi:hypothetical protein